MPSAALVESSTLGPLVAGVGVPLAVPPPELVLVLVDTSASSPAQAIADDKASKHAGLWRRHRSMVHYIHTCDARGATVDSETLQSPGSGGVHRGPPPGVAHKGPRVHPASQAKRSMGKLVDGKWHDVWYDTAQSKGRYQRKDASFRSWVTPDGSAGPSGGAGFAAERGRYHLYVSLACPWAHRTLIFRKLKGLEDMISVSTVNHFMGPKGWTFDAAPGPLADTANGTRLLYEVYLKADDRYTGRVTVPVLWDKAGSTIVSNESGEIIRMLNSAFDGVGASAGDYYPPALRSEIDAVNARVYPTLNNGVYKCGFATTQEAYAESFTALFETMDWLDERLSRQRYLCGDTITEADWRLFTTLIRFDSVYFGHFKVNRRRLADYEHLWAYTRELYQVPGVAATVNMHHIQHHYYGSHPTVNPSRIVPLGPAIDFDEPHGRAL